MKDSELWDIISVLCARVNTLLPLRNILVLSLRQPDPLPWAKS